MNALNKYFIDPIKNHYIDFNGKATRLQYWAFVGFYVLTYIAVLIVSAVLGKVISALSTCVLFAYGVFLLAILVPSLAIGARRLRDAGFSAWWLLLLLVPGIGPLVLLILWLLPSKN